MIDRSFQTFLSSYSAYAETMDLDEIRSSDYSYLDREMQVYLDYAGSSIASATQIRIHSDRLKHYCFGNPHSESPTSRASTELIEMARRDVLAHLNADPAEYVVIFTANASSACRLVGEAYPFDAARRLVLFCDNHNSVVGLREFAKARDAEVRYVPLSGPELRVAEADFLKEMDAAPVPSEDQAVVGHRGLVTYPAQSNFSGVQHPLGWIDAAQTRGYDVLLDAAAFASTNTLDLGRIKPDFTVLSWYKSFGSPTGVGCLIARRGALRRLQRPWFSGGTVQAVSITANWHAMAECGEAFEDGTLNFLNIPDVSVGIEWIQSIGLSNIQERTRCLTGWFLEQLLGMRHTNGSPLARLYGPRSTHARGGTISFNILDDDGMIFDERIVSQESSAHGFSIRTGCFCNPGAGEAAFEVDKDLLRQTTSANFKTIDEHLSFLGLESGGAIRVSLGLASTFHDLAKFLSFMEGNYRDRKTARTELSERRHC